MKLLSALKISPSSRQTITNALIFIAFIWCLWRSSVFLELLFYSQYLDSAGFIDLIKKVIQGQGLLSPSYSSYYAALPALSANFPPAHFAGKFDHIYENTSFVHWHPYFMAYVLAVPVMLGFTPLSVVAFTFSLSTFGLLFLTLAWLKNKGVPLVLGILYTACLFVWAPWAVGAFGQFFYDRLFLLPMAAMIYLVHEYIQKRNNWWWVIILLTTYIDTISERPTLLLAGFFIGYPIIFKGIHAFKEKRCWLLFGLAALNLVWLAYYLKNIQIDQTNSYNLHAVLANLHAIYDPENPLYPKIMKLFPILLSLALLSLFHWRMALIGIGAVVPNLLATVGGAEKIEFITHYHSTYMPFLVVAAAFGLRAAYQRYNQRRWFMPTAIGGLCLIFIYNHYIDYLDLSRHLAFTKPMARYQTDAIFPFADKSIYKNLRQIKDQTQALAAALPPGVTVTMQEPYTPAVMELGHEVNYLPLNLYKNDYAIVTYYSADKPLPDVTNYGPRKKEIEAVYAKVLARNYKPYKEFPVGNERVIIMKRNGAP